MIHRDPVCGKRLNRNKAHIVIAHREIEYFLCCPKCQAEFERDPARWTRASNNGHRKPTARSKRA